MLLGVYFLLTVLHVTKGCTIIDNRKSAKIIKNVEDAVLLPCFCSDVTSTPQKLTWLKHNKLKNEWDSVLTEQDRFQLSNVQNPGNLSVYISHLTVDDEGLYRCQTSHAEYIDIILIVKGGRAVEPSNLISNPLLAFIPVVLLLLGLGGAIFWRCRAKKREQTPSSTGLTGQKNEEGMQNEEQKIQDDVMYTAVIHTNTTDRPKVVSTEDTEYAIIKLKN